MDTTARLTLILYLVYWFLVLKGTRKFSQGWWLVGACSRFPSGTVAALTHVSELLGTRLGLLASICQSTTRNQVMTWL